MEPGPDGSAGWQVQAVVVGLGVLLLAWPLLKRAYRRLRARKAGA